MAAAKEKALLIVESPNKVKTISNILKNNGYKHITVIASVGHIMSLGDGGPAYNSGIYPDKSFKMNLKVSDDKKKVVSEISEKAAAVDKVFIMTDGDREGEIIAWSLIKFCKIPKEKCYRAIAHEITPKALIKAIENPIAFNDRLVDAGLGRMMTDKLIGYGLSPIGKKYIGARSIGRCQSVGLKLVSDREAEIADFIPELYFNLYLDFVKNGKAFRASYFEYDGRPLDRFTSKADAQATYNDCTSGTFYIKDIKTSMHKESPKPPFCTATFQQEAASKLGLRVKDAMSCAQRLFEGTVIDGEHIGLITYMRTDSTSLAEEFIPELKTFISAHYGADAFTPPRATKKKSTDQDGHEALRVVNPALTPEILDSVLDNKLLVKVYRLIWQRTICACMPDAKRAETEYIIKNGKHGFTFSQKELVVPGFHIVNGLKEPDGLESFVLEEQIVDPKLDLVQKFTQPKPRYTESSLVRELEQRGIGRPSTYVSIVETLLNPTRNYATLDNKEIVPTDRGLQLAAYCDRAFPTLINVDYTKQMEELLDKIANGELGLLSYMEKFYGQLQQAIASTDEVGLEQPTETKECPQCGKPMVLRRSKFGKLFYGCSTYPKCKGILNI
jgi:DNA topoisomerase-1